MVVHKKLSRLKNDKYANFDMAMKVFSYLLNSSARAGYDTRSIFRRRLTYLNSEFFFS